MKLTGFTIHAIQNEETGTTSYDVVIDDETWRRLFAAGCWAFAPQGVAAGECLTLANKMVEAIERWEDRPRRDDKR